MKKVNSYLTGPVNRLVKALGAKIRFYSEIKSSKEDIPYFGSYACSSYGFYDGQLDMIALNDLDDIKHFKPIDMDSTVLHELIHWTGVKNRLSRKWIVNNTLRTDHPDSVEPTKAETDTEEATAQIGALKLALVLGLNPARFADFTEQYISKLSGADLEKADKDSDKAVEYLVKFIGMEKVA